MGANVDLNFPAVYSPLVDKTNLFSYQYIPTNSISAIGSSITFQQRYEIPYYNEPVLARAVWTNGTPTGFNVTEFAVSAGSSFTDTNPLMPDGSNSSWNVSSGVPIFVSGTTGGNFQADGYDGVGYSPWTLVSIPPRVDGANMGLLYFRSRYGVSGFCSVGNASNPWNLWSTGTTGNRFRSQMDLQAGAFVNSNQASFVPTTANGQFFPMGVQVIGAKQVVTIAGEGDSTTQGYKTTSDCWSWLAQACNTLSSSRKPYVWQNWAFQGRPSIWFDGVTRTRLSDNQRLPTILVLQPFSQNDAGGYTQSGVEAAWSRCISRALLCYQVGVYPILRTMTPTTAISTNAQESARLWINSGVRSSNMPYYDIDSVVSDNASPARYIAGYSNDGVHLNDYGSQIASQQFVNTLAGLSLF